MPRYAYVNGRFLRHADAAVHIEDRGYQFADGVYEVIAVHGGRLVDAEPHLDRLDRSLRELRIAWPVPRRVLGMLMHDLVRRNGVRLGLIYLQVSRGVAPRDHKFPARCEPALVMTTKRLKPLPAALVETGVAVITIPDIRWARPDIKSVSLLPNVLGKQQAVEAGAFEAWLVDREGFVTEGTSTNAWIVTAQGVVVTHRADRAILGGITRDSVLRLARREGLPVEERPFSPAEAGTAREAFITGTTTQVLAVTRIDGRPVGDGRPGPITRRLRELYLRYISAQEDGVAALRSDLYGESSQPPA
ncbi:MAG: D-amino-acid transaminase [Rhodospirillaceae bacterium]|nr:D-amino-acid transaminase [Rhodospirillaceae bacterium]